MTLLLLLLLLLSNSPCSSPQFICMPSDTESSVLAVPLKQFGAIYSLCQFCSNFFHLLHLLLILQYMYLFSSALSCTTFNYTLLSLILKTVLLHVWNPVMLIFNNCRSSKQCTVVILVWCYYIQIYIHVKFDACTAIYQRYSW